MRVYPHQTSIPLAKLPNNTSQIGIMSIMVALLCLYTSAAMADTTIDPVTSKSMTVYKSPSCGCCTAWVDHVNEAGFSTTVQHPKDLNTIKQTLGISPDYQACHTATWQNYVFEGHIPADVIQHFLTNKPRNALGLAVAGMPMGSPGMDTSRPYRAYQVLQLNQDGSSTPYANVSASNTTYLEKK